MILIAVVATPATALTYGTLSSTSQMVCTIPKITVALAILFPEATSLLCGGSLVVVGVDARDGEEAVKVLFDCNRGPGFHRWNLKGLLRVLVMEAGSSLDDPATGAGCFEDGDASDWPPDGFRLENRMVARVVECRKSTYVTDMGSRTAQTPNL